MQYLRQSHPKLINPKPTQGRRVSERMLTAADQAGGTAGDVLRYFATLVVPLEEGSQVAVTRSFWIGVTLGVVVGMIAGAQI